MARNKSRKKDKHIPKKTKSGVRSANSLILLLVLTNLRAV
jgi:hypothetical protein